MPLPTLPHQLPRPNLTNYGLKPKQTFMRSTFQSGRGRNRRVLTNAPEELALEWTFTTPELMLFELWFRHGINDGQSEFMAVVKTAVGIKPYQIAVVEMYTKQALSAKEWLVRMPCELVERETLDAQWLEFPDLVLSMALVDLAVNG